MKEFSLWINVVGDGDGERPLVNGEPMDVIQAVFDTADEVDNDLDKYYELDAPDGWCYTFNTSVEILDKMGEFV